MGSGAASSVCCRMTGCLACSTTAVACPVCVNAEALFTGLGAHLGCDGGEAAPAEPAGGTAGWGLKLLADGETEILPALAFLCLALSRPLGPAWYSGSCQMQQITHRCSCRKPFHCKRCVFCTVTVILLLMHMHDVDRRCRRHVLP